MFWFWSRLPATSRSPNRTRDELTRLASKKSPALRSIGGRDLRSAQDWELGGDRFDRARRRLFSQAEQALHARTKCGELSTAWRGCLVHPMRDGLFAVLAGEELAHFGFELPVVGMDAGPEGGFGGAALTDAFQDALHVTHAVSLGDVLH